MTRTDEQNYHIKEYHKFFTSTELLILKNGDSLSEFTLCYETHGILNGDSSNAILIFHALSGDSHIAKHHNDDHPGWWDVLVGPDKYIDTNTFFVICANTIGGCSGSTGPGNINPDSGHIYGSDFPDITIEDMAAAQKKLIDYLGIKKLHAVIGGSMGGQLALSWGILFPDSAHRIVLLATSARLSSQALAFDIVGRNAIRHDQNFHDGEYALKGVVPKNGLAIARMIGHITYLSPEVMRDKFESSRHNPRDIDTTFEKNFSVGSYLSYQGEKFVERFDANSYITLTQALDSFDQGSTACDIAKKMRNSKSKWLIISFSSDWLFTPDDSLKITEALVLNHTPVSHYCIQSSAGHDAFLLENDSNQYGTLISNFLQPNSENNTNCCNIEDTNTVLLPGRNDLSFFAQLIAPESSVLDLGSGNGELLACLRGKGATHIQGLDIDFDAISNCVKKDIPAISFDLANPLPFPDNHFDYVILSLTLQAVKNTEQILTEITRVGKQAVISIPNFAYYKLRKMFNDKGLAPVSPGILHYQWYNTPNIRFFSIIDFEMLCDTLGIRITKRYAFDTESAQTIDKEINSMADMAVYILEKAG